MQLSAAFDDRAADAVLTSLLGCGLTRQQAGPGLIDYIAELHKRPNRCARNECACLACCQQSICQLRRARPYGWQPAICLRSGACKTSSSRRSGQLGNALLRLQLSNALLRLHNRQGRGPEQA